MSPKWKYWIFLFAIALAVFSVILGSFALSWLHLSAQEQELVREFAPRLLPFPLVGAFFLFMIIGGLVSLLFNNYIIPLLRLAEETRLITTANPEHRITPRGAKELVQLSAIINDTAEAIQKLRGDVRGQIRQARNQLKQERNRLAALMSELPGGVLVCNTNGQILLYNPQAQLLLQRPGHLIGLGRSLFSVLEREPIIHALGLLQQAARQGQKAPTTRFMMRLHDSLSLRLGMAPVFTGKDEQQLITGFVLTVEDVTGEIEAQLRHDLMFQTLTEAMQFSIGEIREAISAILADPAMPEELSQGHRLTIDRASRAIEEQVQVAKTDYARLRFASTATENVLGEYLLELLCSHLRERLRLRVEACAESDLWLQINSYTLVQGLAQLGENLRDEGIHTLSLRLEQAGDDERRALLSISWPGCRLAQSMLLQWQRRPLVQDSRNQLVSFHELVRQCGGDIRVIAGEGDQCENLQLRLPLARPEELWQAPARPEDRPISYEFDLFRHTGGTEIGQTPLNKLTFVVFDTETTGLNPSAGDEIIQLGAIRIVNGRILYDETLDQLVDPQRPVPAASVRIHGIAPELLQGQPTIDRVLRDFHHFAENSVLVAHNAAFDMRFLQLAEGRAGVNFDHPVLDTLLLSSVIHPNLEHHSLDEIAQRLHIPIVGRHTALGDAIVTAEVLVRLLPLLQASGIHTFEEALRACAASPFAKLKF